MAGFFKTPILTRRRIVLALLVASVADALQLALGPLGWVWADEALDVVVMIAVSALIGFHPIFLPAFILEFVPVVDAVPFWTACVATVAILRRRQERSTPPPKPANISATVIDV